MAQTLDTLIVELKADIKGLQAGLRTATGEVGRFTGESEQQIGVLSGAIGRARTAFLAFGSAWAGFRVGQNLFNAGAQFEALNSKMLAATGSSEAAAQSMAFLRAETERLGLNFTSTADSFSSFAAAALRSGLSLTEVQQVFLGVSEAATAFRLSNERVQLVFGALSQIAAKGVVSMEELRQQLGESLPIALDAAARGMGVTQAELIKMVERGDLAAKDFLPRFGQAISANLGDAITKASGSATANLNRVNNSLENLKATVAGGGFLQALASSFKAVNEAVNTPALREGLTLIGQVIGGLLIIISRVVAGLAIMIQKLVDLGRAAKSLIGFGGQQASAPAVRPEQNRATFLVPDAQFNTINPKSANMPELDIRRGDLQKTFELEQSYRDLGLEAEAGFQDSLTAMRREAYDQRLADLQTAAEGFLGVEMEVQDKSLAEQGQSFRSSIKQAAQHNKTFFALEKAAAIARALISARQSVVDAYAFGTKLGGPVLGAAFAGVAAAAQAANIASIASTSYGGGGGVSSAGGGGSGEIAPADDLGRPVSTPTRQVYISLQGDENMLFSKKTVRQLLEHVNDALKDGSRLDVVAVA
ncbi:MAG: tape measure protein [Aquamicrobium sp.]|nr:tape measure protein [Aquamicrobium sp.]